MMLRHWAAMVLGLGGCAAGARSTPAEQETWSHAVVMADCAPWDGAATSILLSQESLSDHPEGRPLLRLSIYSPTLSVAGTRWPVGEAKAGGGQASWCPATGDCDYATAGWVELAAWPEGRPLAGRYQVTLASGRTVAGSFTAILDPRRVMCG